jgi:hypothetical protein
MARTQAQPLRKKFTENVMSGRPTRIICDRPKAQPAASGDWHDTGGHHRYYGSSATNGGERLSETRRSGRPHAANVRGL